LQGAIERRLSLVGPIPRARGERAVAVLDRGAKPSALAASWPGKGESSEMRTGIRRDKEGCGRAGAHLPLSVVVLSGEPLASAARARESNLVPAKAPSLRAVTNHFLSNVGDLAFTRPGPSDRELTVDLRGKTLGDLVT
jgi:hypothetical protein